MIMKIYKTYNSIIFNQKFLRDILPGQFVANMLTVIFALTVYQMLITFLTRCMHFFLVYGIFTIVAPFVC